MKKIFGLMIAGMLVTGLAMGQRVFTSPSPTNVTLSATTPTLIVTGTNATSYHLIQNTSSWYCVVWPTNSAVSYLLKPTNGWVVVAPPAKDIADWYGIGIGGAATVIDIRELGQ